MCEYCTKDGFTKTLLEAGFPNPKTAVSIDIGYSDKKNVPAIVLCSPTGLAYKLINYCPMCGKKLISGK